MRKFKIIFTFIFFVWILGFPKSSNINFVMADEWFNSYDLKTSQNYEKAILNDFAYFLKKNSNMVGYIAFYTGNDDTKDKVKSRVKRAEKYLISKLKIDKNRLIIVNAGKTNNESLIVLQPVLKNNPPPNF